MRSFRSALDVDGVLANFSAGVLRLIEEVTKRRFAITDITGWDFAEALGLSDDDRDAVYEGIGRRGFAASLPPYPHARQGVRRLRELGDVFCVTHPWDSPWWKPERNSWLALHFGIDVVHYDSVKHTYEADLFVDDKASHVRDWIAAWPGRTAVLWRTPHNTSEAVPAGAYATSSWDELYDIARHGKPSERVSQEVAS